MATRDKVRVAVVGASGYSGIEAVRILAGHPFAEILHTWTEDGETRHALSRVWWSLSDTPHGRAAEVQAFLKRRQQ